MTESDGRLRLGRVVTVAVTCLALTLAAGPVYAGALGAMSGGQADQSAACPGAGIDVEGELGDLIGETADSLPDVAKDAVVGERVQARVGDARFGVVVDSEGTVTETTRGKLDGATLKARTDCETVTRIANAEDKRATARRAISTGDITWEGVGGVKNVQVAFGSKAVQVYEIIDGGNSTGNAGDAADGFSKGFGDSLSWAADTL